MKGGTLRKLERVLRIALMFIALTYILERMIEPFYLLRELHRIEHLKQSPCTLQARKDDP
jgi:hypothetical protein